uniref:Uncharacterized protein n=1 Tax=viral metagenome TaxID=1070528 RepID=A0A6C0BMU3_9ZZZZ
MHVTFNQSSILQLSIQYHYNDMITCYINHHISTTI